MMLRWRILCSFLYMWLSLFTGSPECVCKPSCGQAQCDSVCTPQPCFQRKGSFLILVFPVKKLFSSLCYAANFAAKDLHSWFVFWGYHGMWILLSKKGWRVTAAKMIFQLVSSTIDNKAPLFSFVNRIGQCWQHIWTTLAWIIYSYVPSRWTVKGLSGLKF